MGLVIGNIGIPRPGHQDLPFLVESRMTTRTGITLRLATLADLPAIRDLMDASIRTLVGATLDRARLEASFEIMGVDTQLIEDGTYFVVEIEGRMAGCGGWGRRATLFGGDHSTGRDARLLDPATEPARVRAMYTHPDFARRGVGRQILARCEEAAAREGFRTLELMSTIAGEPLYLACGYELIERVEAPTSKGVTIPLARMMKSIPTPGAATSSRSECRT
jgi:GNAT superfamily N-acetyltransferase